MSDDPITILIADDNADARATLRRQLEFGGLAVVGEAALTAETVTAAGRLAPDVVLVDLDPDGLDGLAATAQIASRLPGTTVVVLAVGDEIDTIRRAMLAGARAFLTRPFVTDELVAVIRQARNRTVARANGLQQIARVISEDHEAAPRGQVVAVYGPSGGVGRTTIAVNLAVSTARQGRRIALMDASLQFGDVGAFLDLPPNAATLADLFEEGAEADGDLLEGTLQRHDSGIHVLLAPARPDDATIHAAGLERIVSELAGRYELVLIDMGLRLDEAALTLLDRADRIVLTTTLEVGAVKNAGLFLDLCRRLGYEDEKLVLVANRVGSTLQLSRVDVERALGRQIAATIAEEPQAALSLNKGIPLVKARPRSAFATDIARVMGIVDRHAADAVQPSVVQRAWQGAVPAPVNASGPAAAGRAELGYTTFAPRSWPARLLQQRSELPSVAASSGD